jgi:agmatinase
MDSIYLDENLKLSSTQPLESARNVILGVPADYTQTNRVGARYAPLEIRRQFLELEKEWEMLSFHDLGDVIPHLGDMKKTCERVSAVVSEATEKTSARLILLGGEHTITYGAVKALKPEVFVQFDAHMDLKDEYLSQKFCHATVARRVAELGLKTVQVGVRSASLEEREYAKKEGVKQFLGEDASKLLKTVKDRKTYVSVDLDVLDPSYAPGVGNPEPSGLSLNTLMILIDTLTEGCRVVGLDLVEACPHYDNGIACLTAAHIMVGLMAKR